MASTLATLQQTIQLEPTTHTYTVNGRTVISVTQVLSRAGLIDDRWYTEESRQRGRRVHLACQLDDENDLDEASLHPADRPYLDAHRRFRDETGFQPQLIEYPVYDNNRVYVGTLDRFGIFKDGEPGLIDYKTGEIQFWAYKQTAAYSNALKGKEGPRIRRYIVQLQPDGRYKLEVCKAADYITDLNDFFACLRVANLQAKRS